MTRPEDVEPDPAQPDPAQPDPAGDQAGITADGLQRLWAPWRSRYVTDADRIDGCPFCVLPARGRDRDRESLILHRGPQAYVVLNAYPYNPGHLLVVPYAHVAELGDLADDAASELWTLARRAVAVLRDRLHSEGVNLGANLGVAAGAGIADHVHLHAVPRWAGDTNFVSVAGATRVLPRALDEVYGALAGAFA